MYYTGRGYFLVTPEKGQEIGRDQKRILRRLVDSNTQITSMATKTFKVMDGKWEIDFDDEFDCTAVQTDLAKYWNLFAPLERICAKV